MAEKDIEKLTGEIFADDITELVQNINKNKNRLDKVRFDRNGDHWSFEIENEDSKDQKKLLLEIQKFINKLEKRTDKKNKVKREKNGVKTDEVIV